MSLCGKLRPLNARQKQFIYVCMYACHLAMYEAHKYSHTHSHAHHGKQGQRHMFWVFWPLEGIIREPACVCGVNNAFDVC